MNNASILNYKALAKKALAILLTLLLVSLFAFALANLGADDAVDIMYRQSGAVDPSIIAKTRAELGLDKPLAEQYFSWLLSFLAGDAGRSLSSGQPVSQLLLSKLPTTLLLTVLSLILTLLISISAGLYCALKRNSIADYLLRFAAFSGNSLPSFCVSFLLLYIFSLKLGLLPVLSNGVSLSSYLLPAFSLAIPMSAKYIRYVRGEILTELEQPYVAASLLRGLSFRAIFCNYVLRSLFLHLLSIIALSIGSLLGGATIIESIFMLDGMGKLAVDAILRKDIPVLQAYVIWSAIIYISVNLIADITAYTLDPRQRAGKAG